MPRLNEESATEPEAFPIENEYLPPAIERLPMLNAFTSLDWDPLPSAHVPTPLAVTPEPIPTLFALVTVFDNPNASEFAPLISFPVPPSIIELLALISILLFLPPIIEAFVAAAIEFDVPPIIVDISP